MPSWATTGQNTKSLQALFCEGVLSNDIVDFLHLCVRRLAHFSSHAADLATVRKES